MWRIVLGVVVAILANDAVLTAGDYTMFRGSPGDPATLLDRMSPDAKFIIVVSWGVGALAAAIAAAVVSQRGWLAWVGASTTLIAVLATAFNVPHPPWMVAAGIVLPVLAAFAASSMIPTGHRAPGPEHPPLSARAGRIKGRLFAPPRTRPISPP